MSCVVFRAIYLIMNITLFIYKIRVVKTEPKSLITIHPSVVKTVDLNKSCIVFYSTLMLYTVFTFERNYYFQNIFYRVHVSQ